MIFPFLRGIESFENAPLTWLIIFFSSIVYLSFLPEQLQSHGKLEALLQNPQMGETQARVYLSYLEEKDSTQLNTYQSKLLEKQEEQIPVLGQALRLSMQDSGFQQAVSSMEPRGDLVAFNHWQDWNLEFHEGNKTRPMSIYGLSSFNDSWTSLITYQYVHGSLMHLLANMVVLLIFGSALERVLGSLNFILLYTASGVAGALAFTQFSGLSVAPLVGASGAVSGLIAFYAFFERKRRVRFVYLLAPIEGYFGFLYLHPLVILPVMLFADLAQLIQQGPSVGGIAYSAHVGGAILGIMVAAAFGPLVLLGRRKTSA